MKKVLLILLSLIVSVQVYMKPGQAKSFQSHIKETTVQDSSVYTLSKDKTFQYTILYLHGGAYTNPIHTHHWKYCDRLAQKLDAKVILPEYPLVPEGNWNDAYRLLLSLYKNISKKKPIIIVGDSAGGGLAAGFCEYLAKKDIHQPNVLILFSPWLDIACSNPDMENYTDTDIHLHRESLQKVGRQWADGLDVTDYRVSPIYGDVDDLRNVHLFTGTNEIFYPDITKFYRKLKKHHVSTKITIGKNMYHNYPLYLGSTEDADRAFDTVISDIKKQK